MQTNHKCHCLFKVKISQSTTQWHDVVGMTMLERSRFVNVLSQTKARFFIRKGLGNSCDSLEVNSIRF